MLFRRRVSLYKCIVTTHFQTFETGEGETSRGFFHLGNFVSWLSKSDTWFVILGRVLAGPFGFSHTGRHHSSPSYMETLDSKDGPYPKGATAAADDVS